MTPPRDSTDWYGNPVRDAAERYDRSASRMCRAMCGTRWPAIVAEWRRLMREYAETQAVGSGQMVEAMTWSESLVGEWFVRRRPRCCRR
jgi:hypothetical protein